jgi:AsmA protein
MSRASKFVLWFVIAAVALFVASAVAFRLFFDPNDFREKIETAVYESTGRELKIEGDVGLQLFPWLAVEVGRTRLGNAPEFGDGVFAEFESARLSVRALPLLFGRELSIGTVALDGFRLDLRVDERGRRNWSDLLSSDAPADDRAVPPSGPPTAPPGRASLEVSGVDISNASITYVHAPKGDRYAFTDANLKIGRINESGDPIPVEGGLAFDVQPAGYSGTIELATSVSFDTASGAVAFGESSLEATVAGIADEPARLAFGTRGIDVDTVAKTAAVGAVELSVLGIEMRADVQPFSYADAIQPQAAIRIDAFSPRNVMRLLGVEPPATADPAALTRVILDAKANMGDDLVRLTDLNIKLDDTSFSGSMTVPFDSAGRFIAKLDGDAINLDRYMQPAAEGAAGGEAGPAPIAIPADLLRPLNVRGELTLDSVMMSGLRLEEVSVTVNAKDGKLRINPITAQLFGGNYSGDITIVTSTSVPSLSVDETVQGIDLAKLAKAMFDQDNITGSIAGNFRLGGSGRNMAEIQQTLNGTMSFELRDGTYEGTDVWYELRRARAALKQETPPEPVLPARTKFTTVTASGVVRNGVMRNDDLAAELPFMKLTGRGDVNIPQGTVDYSLQARVLKKPEAMAGATPEEIEDFTKTVIPLKITGSLASPTVRPDLESLLKQRVEEEVKEKIEEKLKDLFKR